MNAEQAMTAPALPWSARTVLRQLERLQRGSLSLTLPNGNTHLLQGSQSGAHAQLRVHDWRVFRALLSGGGVRFAEDYRDGLWDTEQLTQLLLFAQQNRQALQGAVEGNPLFRAFYRLRHQLRANTRRGSRKNIHAHYDLGNDFYSLWLDSTMTYSSAWFGGDYQRPLAQAQAAKYQRILEQLDARPGQHILEIGCGWGGFAEHAARAGMRVTGITLSPAQLRFAQARMERQQLSELVSLQLCDYRDLQGEFDHIVSIEMVEAVGERWWPRYFNTLRQHLRPGGRAVVQSITIAGDGFEHYRRNSDFIQQYIFPGGMLPTDQHLVQLAEQQGLAVRDQAHFGEDYAHTLKLWHEHFLQHSAQLNEMGYDPRFQRLWAFYLSYCEAGFLSRHCDVLQLTYELPAEAHHG